MNSLQSNVLDIIALLVSSYGLGLSWGHWVASNLQHLLSPRFPCTRSASLVWSITPTPASVTAAGIIPVSLEPLSSWVPEPRLPFHSTGGQAYGCRNQNRSLGRGGQGSGYCLLAQELRWSGVHLEIGSDSGCESVPRRL